MNDILRFGYVELKELNKTVEEYKSSLKNEKYRPTEIDNLNELTLLKLFRDNKGWN